MAIKLTNGSVFLHVPKTGGSWVEKVLADYGLVECRIAHEHADYDRVLYHEQFLSGRDLAWRLARKKVLRLLRLYRGTPAAYTFCFVRHPLQWYESWWKYMKALRWSEWGKENSKDNWHPNAILNGLGDDDFNTFVRNVIKKRPGYVSELYFSYTKPGINFIGQTENIVEHLIQILRSLGISVDETLIRNYPKVNVSETSPSEISWDPNLKRTVTMLELPALIHFGYLSKEEGVRLGIAEDIEPNKALVQSCRPHGPTVTFATHSRSLDSDTRITFDGDTNI